MIRNACENDCERIYDLICEMRGEKLDFPMFAKIYSFQIHNDNYAHFVYEHNGEVVGIIAIRLEYQLHHAARVAEIMELAVKDGFRSQGIGKRLFTVAREYSIANNAVILEVASGKARTGAHCFYEKNGMTVSHFKMTVSLDGTSRKV